MTIGAMSADEWTFPPRDYVPVTPGADNLPDNLGWQPRGVFCGVAGTLVFRCDQSDVDRTIPVLAGQTVTGTVTHVLTGTDCEPHLIR